MGNSRNTGYLQNAVKVADNGDISLMHGSTMLMQISSSGAITTTGVISGSNALSASYAATASFVTLAQTASFVTTAQTASFVTTAQTASFVANAQSASNAVTAQTASFANTFTVASTLTAQTLVVQTITSSVDFVTGSTRFGSLSSNTHIFTGSLAITGGLAVNAGTTTVGVLSGSSAFFSNGLVNIGNTVNVGNTFNQNYGALNVRGTGNQLYNGITAYTNDGTDSFIGLGCSSTTAGINVTYGSTGAYLPFVVITGGSERMRITSGGNVGIGTTNPQNILHIKSGTSGLASYDARYKVVLENNGEAYYVVTVPDNSYAGMRILNTSSAARGAFEYYMTDDLLHIYSAGSARFHVGGGEKVRITSAGNVGIGTTNPANTLHVNGSLRTGGSTTYWYTGNDGGGMYLETAGTSTATRALRIQGINDAGNRYSAIKLQAGAEVISFETADVERMRITNEGFVKISNTGVYNTAQSYHEMRSSGADWTCTIHNLNSSSPNGIAITYTQAAPNGSSNQFIYCNDTSTVRFTVKSNGGINNYQANDTNLSDIRTKKDIIPLESYWDKFKAIEIVKFKYKDQTHDDFNIGVIAQQVEEVAPEFIDTDEWGKVPEDGVPLKSIYTSDLHHTTIKVLQEAMAKIEEQQAQIEELKAIING